MHNKIVKKNTLTHGEVMLKIKVAYFFMGHSVVIINPEVLKFLRFFSEDQFFIYFLEVPQDQDLG